MFCGKAAEDVDSGKAVSPDDGVALGEEFALVGTIGKLAGASSVATDAFAPMLVDAVVADPRLVAANDP